MAFSEYLAIYILQILVSCGAGRVYNFVKMCVSLCSSLCIAVNENTLMSHIISERVELRWNGLVISFFVAVLLLSSLT